MSYSLISPLVNLRGIEATLMKTVKHLNFG